MSVQVAFYTFAVKPKCFQKSRCGRAGRGEQGFDESTRVFGGETNHLPACRTSCFSFRSHNFNYASRGAHGKAGVLSLPSLVLHCISNGFC